MPDTFESLGFEPIVEADVRIPREAPNRPGYPTIAYSKNNPGNIRVPGKKEFRQYGTPEEGFNEILKLVKNRAAQGHTLESYISSYAPKEDDNDTEGYIQRASKELGVDRKTSLRKLDNAKLAAFQAKQESGTQVKVKDTFESLGFEPIKTEGPMIGPARDIGKDPWSVSGVLEAMKRTVLGSPKTGVTPIGRAAHLDYDAPSEDRSADTRMLHMEELAPGKPTTVAGGIGKGLLTTASGFTTPENALMLAGSGGLGLLGKVHGILPRAVSAYFTKEMVHGLYEKRKDFKEAWDSGDAPRIAQVFTEGAAQAGMAGLAATHAVKGGKPAVVSEPRESASPVTETKETPPIEPLGTKPEGPTIGGEDYLRAQAAKHPAARPPAQESAEVFQKEGPTYAELFDQAEKLAAKKARTKPEVPETGDPNERETYARENLAQKLSGKPYTELEASDQSAIDDLVKQKYGSAVAPEAPATSSPPPSPGAGPSPAVSPSAEPQAAPPTPTSPAAQPATGQIKVGATFDTERGTFTIKGVANGLVTFERESPSGQIVKGKLPTVAFRKNIGTLAKLAQPEPITPEASPVIPESGLGPIGGAVEPGGRPTEIPTDVLRRQTQPVGEPEVVPFEQTAAGEAEAAAKAPAESIPAEAATAPTEPPTALSEVGQPSPEAGTVAQVPTSQIKRDPAIRPTLDSVWNELAAMRGRAEKESSPAPVKNATTPEPVSPSEPEIKTSKLALGVEEKAIANKLSSGFEGKPEYTVVKVAEQAKAAADLLKSDRQRAIKVAMGMGLPPEGVLPESIFVAVENHAITTKNISLLRDLATSSGLTSEATGMGQRIRMLAERDPESPVTAIQQVTKAREGAAIKKFGPKPIEKVRTEIKIEMRKSAPKMKDWAAFVDSLKCT